MNAPLPPDDTVGADPPPETVTVTGPGAYTVVTHAGRIRSTNPGYCFLAAGWRRLSGRTAARGLRILVLEP